MPGSTYSLYDSNGNRVLVQEQNLLDLKNITTRQMVYAADGTLLQKNDGTASSLSTMVNNKVQYASITAGGVAHHFSSNGNYLGEIAKDKAGRISSSLKDQHYTAPTQHDSSNVTQYQVQSGDSLKSLALNFYGNADYWYLIANLNGLTSSPDEALSAGLSIDIPARASSSNSANSFKPMDLQKIIGDTTPSLPYVPPAPAAGCNAIATIVMVVVTVVVTAVTGQPALGAAAGDAARQTTTAMLNGQFDWGGFVRGNLNPLNMAKKAMMMSVPAYGAYELNKALQGNDRSQALFNPLEYGFDYDYKSTAIAAAASYAGSELGAGVSGAVGSTAGQVAGAMVQAGVSYASTVQLNRWVGRQMEFKFSSMAAGMVGAGITAGIFGAENVNGATPKAGPMAFNWREISKAVFSAETVQRFGIGMAQNAMQYGLGKLFGDRSASWNFGNAAADAFGNALGNSIVAKLNSKTLTPQQAGQKAMRDAKAAGLTDDEIQIAMLEATLEAAPEGAKAKARLGYSIDDDAIRLRVANEEGLTLPRNFSSLQDVQAQHSSLLDFMQTYKLTGEQGALDFSLAMFGMRSSVYSAENIERQSKLAFDNGVVEGLHKVRAATAQRNASFNGFRADLMTQEDWGHTIANQTRQWSQQNATSAMMFVAGVATLPMLAADLLAVGALAGRGAMALGRGVMNTADDMGRSLYASYQATGIRGTLLSAASPTTSWATVQSASLTAMRGMTSLTPGSAELALTQFARTATGYSAQLGSAAWSGATNVASRIGLTRLPMPFAGADFVSGGISGSVNVAFEYAKNPSKSALDYSVDFATGFAGGVVGNWAATGMKNMLLVGAHSSVARSNALIKSEIIGGFVSGSVSNYLSQTYSVWQKPQENSFDRSKFIEATLFSGFVGGGVAKTWPNLATNTQFGINANFGSVLQNWQEFYDRYFGSSGQ